MSRDVSYDGLTPLLTRCALCWSATWDESWGCTALLYVFKTSWWFISLVFGFKNNSLEFTCTISKNWFELMPDFQAKLFLYFIFIIFCLFCTFRASNLASQHALFAEHSQRWTKYRYKIIQNSTFLNVTQWRRTFLKTEQREAILQNEECSEWMTGMM